MQLCRLQSPADNARSLIAEPEIWPKFINVNLFYK
jgi:hypothetical protein